MRGMGGCGPPSPLIAVRNVTAHPSTASVPITVLLNKSPLLCMRFNVPCIKWLTCHGVAMMWYAIQTVAGRRLRPRRGFVSTSSTSSGWKDDVEVFGAASVSVGNGSGKLNTRLVSSTVEDNGLYSGWYRSPFCGNLSAGANWSWKTPYKWLSHGVVSCRIW